MSQNPLDQSVLDELQEATGSEFAQELVTTFLDEAPGMMADLQAALAAGDADGFRRAAHSLKSNASTFGAQVLAARARDIELSAMDAAALPALQTAYTEAAASLQAYIDG